MSIISFIDHLFCLWLGFIFAWGAASHVIKWEQFRDLVSEYRLTPARVAPLAAIVIVLAEILTAVLIVAPGPSRYSGLVLGACLLTALAMAVMINLLRGRHSLSCGCDLFAEDQPIAWRLVLRNILLAGVASILVFLPRIVPDVAEYLLACSVMLAFAAGQIASGRLRLNHARLGLAR